MKAKWILTGMALLAISLFVGCPNPGTNPSRVIEGKEWTVSFETYGGTPVPDQIVANNGKIVPVSTTYEGHSLYAWFSDETFYVYWDFGYPVTQDMTLYADWRAISDGYNVNFVTNGGSMVYDQVIQEGNLVDEPTKPTKTGHSFAGWYSDIWLTQKWNFASNRVYATTTLYAKWEVIGTGDSYLVSFNTDGGEPIPDQPVTHGGKIVPISPIKAGYYFSGWYTDSYFYGAWDFENGVVTEPMTLYAEFWEVWPGYFNVRFETNGGNLILDWPVEANSRVTEPSAPSKEGYVFGGWFRDAALTQAWSFSTNITQTTTLYAKWVTAFAVTFDSNQGSYVETQLVPVGSKAVRPSPAPTKDGYRLAGWYTDTALANEWNFNDTVTGDMTLYAKWTQVFAAAITFVTNDPDITVPELPAVTGDKIKRPPQVKVNTAGTQACVGWYTDENFTNEWDFLTRTVDGPMILYAKWSSTVKNIWISDNINDGGLIFAGPDGTWDNDARAVPERRLFQRSDGTHYIDLSSRGGNAYFRFTRTTSTGAYGRYQPSSQDYPVAYNSPMTMQSTSNFDGAGLSWMFDLDGDFVITLDSNTNPATFTLLRPYTVSSVAVSPESRRTDSGTARTFQYTAELIGEYAPKGITWTLEGATNGSTISSSGLVSVTAAETPKPLTIRATSQAAPAISGTATLLIQEPSLVPIVYGVTVSPPSARIMKAYSATGDRQMHGSATMTNYQQLFTATVSASGGASEAVTYSFVNPAKQVKPGTRIRPDNVVIIDLSEENTTLTLRATSVADPTKYCDVPITVQSFDVWLVGSSTSWNRGFLMTDNGNGTYTYTGTFTASAVAKDTDRHEGFSFNTNKTTGGVEGSIGWGNDAWYTLSAQNTELGVGTFNLRAYQGQNYMFRVRSAAVGVAYTLVLDVTVPRVTVTLAPAP